MKREREQGVILKWWPTKGFGFLEPTPPNGESGIFLHISDVAAGVGVPIGVGDEVEFERLEISKGLRAIKARIIRDVERGEVEHVIG